MNSKYKKEEDEVKLSISDYHDFNRRTKRHSTEKQLYMLAKGELKSCFQKIPCYSQFTRLMQNNALFRFYLRGFTQLNANKIQKFCIVDSTALPVSGYNKMTLNGRLNLQVGKNMHGYYQGLNYIIINQDREIISIV